MGTDVEALSFRPRALLVAAAVSLVLSVVVVPFDTAIVDALHPRRGGAWDSALRVLDAMAPRYFVIVGVGLGAAGFATGGSASCR